MMLWAAPESSPVPPPSSTPDVSAVPSVPSSTVPDPGWTLTQPWATLGAGLLAVLAASIAFFAAHRVYKQTERHFRTTNRQDRYTTIATQLADANPAVRIAAVYALEALADDWLNSGSVSRFAYLRARAWNQKLRDEVRARAMAAATRQAQACINVLCGYLRTPLASPPDNQHTLVERSVTTNGEAAAVEDRHAYQPNDLHVRKVITDVIEGHCKRIDLNGRCWSDLRFEFGGAHLYDAHFSYCEFSGPMDFMGAVFYDGGSFDGCVFKYGAFFSRTHFIGGMGSFYNAEFCKGASFSSARFDHGGWFDEAVFREEASFDRVAFDHSTRFQRVQFLGPAEFKRATFSDEADFTGAEFNDVADFDEAEFATNVVTEGAAFAKGFPAQIEGPRSLER
ncbi:pentapeptide repeat-containing protein [Gordonia sp. NPDC003424]